MTKYEFEGQVFVEMPALISNDCRGCYFEDGVNLDTNHNGTTPCPHTKNIRFCDIKAPILVLDTPEAIANYMNQRLDT